MKEILKTFIFLSLLSVMVHLEELYYNFALDGDKPTINPRFSSFTTDTVLHK